MTRFPDVSGVPNLVELKLERCKNLIAIDHSVGFLEKLKYLMASGCIKLEDFPPRIRLPSLEYLNLALTNIAVFPHIEERMSKPLEIWLMTDRIELPDSISNLVGLKRIVVECKSLTRGGLPSDLFNMPAITEINFRFYSPQDRELFRRLINSHVIPSAGRSTLNDACYSPLREMGLANCGLKDEDLHNILCCFPYLEKLSVQKNDFVFVPASIKESMLRTFAVDRCKMLEEIPELPESIQCVLAYECSSMSAETSRKLWSQVRILLKFHADTIFSFLTQHFSYTHFYTNHHIINTWWSPHNNVY